MRNQNNINKERTPTRLERVPIASTAFFDKLSMPGALSLSKGTAYAKGIRSRIRLVADLMTKETTI
jgi:hypothetical protein